MSRPYTQEEIMRQFLDYFSAMVDFWADVKGKNDKEKLSGLAFSILSMLDGCAGDLPAFEVIPTPHPEDKEYLKSQGENWYPDVESGDEAVTVHGDHMLHELWHRFRRGEL